jgi:hypothetical protein
VLNTENTPDIVQEEALFKETQDQLHPLPREAENQALFQRTSNDILEIPDSYFKVAVLIIRWDESIDDLKGHTEEVSDVIESEWDELAKASRLIVFEVFLLISFNMIARSVHSETTNHRSTSTWLS